MFYYNPYFYPYRARTGTVYWTKEYDPELEGDLLYLSVEDPSIAYQQLKISEIGIPSEGPIGQDYYVGEAKQVYANFYDQYRRYIASAVIQLPSSVRSGSATIYYS